MNDNAGNSTGITPDNDTVNVELNNQGFHTEINPNAGLEHTNRDCGNNGDRENANMGSNSTVHAGFEHNEDDLDNNTGRGRNITPNVQGKKSFASLFKDNRNPVEASLLHFIDPPIGKVIIDVDEIDSVEKTYGFCLIGYVMGTRPSPFAVLNFVKRWGDNVKFLFKENGWIQFQFPNELDRDRILNGGHYKILGRQLFLKKMPDCFMFSKEEMEFIPSWVQIYGLPKQCWTPPALSKIASVVGKPIHTDMLTFSKKGATYARVLVEMDAKNPRIWDYEVQLPTGKLIIIKFKYEVEPKYCDKCHSLGHLAELCGADINRKQQKKFPNTSDKELNSGSTKEVLKKNNMEDVGTGNLGDTPGSSGTKNLDINDDQQLPDVVISEDSPKEDCTSSVPQSVGTHQPNISKGKGIAVEVTGGNHWKEMGQDPVEVNVADDGQCRDVPTDEGLSAFEGSDSNEFFNEGYELDNEEIQEMISRVQTQDRHEWKTVTRKNKKSKKKKNSRKGVIDKKLDVGASSLDTEVIPIDPVSKLPLKGNGSRFFKKKSIEERPPDTASGSL